MSFKEVRDLAEHLKLLGYPHVFPLQALANNFGSLASFHVVAELLQWLAGLLEPGAVLGGSVETENDRVLLIRSATEFFVTKSAIKLNPRKLYASSAVTAAELQKITRMLIAPQQSGEDKDDEENYRSLNQVDIGDKMDDLRRARELSADLTQRGAALHELLAKEMLHREARLAQANRPMELSSAERTLKNAIAAAQLKLQSSRAQLENARVEMNALTSKLQRKRAELERTKQRLEALQKIRPAHMQEFEDCEKELQELFQRYFLRLHVRDALRAQYEARTKRSTPVASPMLQKAQESSMPFIPEGLIEDDDDNNGEAELDGSGVLRHGNFGLDAEIPDIRDEDMMLRNRRSYSGLLDEAARKMNKRPGTATSRNGRPITGRNRRPQAERAAADDGGDGGAMSSMLSNRATLGGVGDEDDSSFGSSDSDLGMGGMLSMGRGPAPSGLLSNLDSELGDFVDDDFDLNSMDDISISKITGELPLRPKTASKPDHHSDEDF
ncbi:clusterin-associated protein 1 homolog [Anastrepha ludens]|uniref:clusterin-associated protein 1 homolog n=1 Tax=Anastrepha ludens TaxID=28586 RepID=UPI0023AF2FE9|nr:clusterin-associated protein 1 homolog [Anastrepha ludens]